MRKSTFMRTCLTAAAALLLAAGLNAAEMHVTEAQVKEAAITKVLPEYPPVARQLRVTGKVELELSIAESGAVQQVKIVSGSPVLTRPCAKALQEWKFRPFTQDGKPVRAVAPISFEFR